MSSYRAKPLWRHLIHQIFLVFHKRNMKDSHQLLINQKRSEVTSVGRNNQNTFCHSFYKSRIFLLLLESNSVYYSSVPKIWYFPFWENIVRNKFHFILVYNHETPEILTTSSFPPWPFPFVFFFFYALEHINRTPFELIMICTKSMIHGFQWILTGKKQVFESISINIRNAFL